MRATHLYIVFTAILLSNAALALEIKSSLRDDAVLAQGSRLVAGEPGKDEFFILGNNEASPVRDVTAPVKTVALKHIDDGNKKIAAPMKMAMKQPHTTTISKASMIKIRMAFRQASRKPQHQPLVATTQHAKTMSHVVSRKNAFINKLALSQPVHIASHHAFLKAAVKHHVAKLRYALANKQSLAKIRLAVDQAIHKAKAVKTVMNRVAKARHALANKKKQAKTRVTSIQSQRAVRLAPTVINL